MIFLYFFWVDFTYRQNILEVRVLEQFYGYESKFVYYEDLKNTYPHWYAKLRDGADFISSNHEAKMLSIANTMRGWANVEAQKEIQLLKEYFGVNNLSISPTEMYTSSFGKELIDALNATMQFKGAYERHLARIAKGHAKITGASLFANTFSDVLGTLISEKYNQIMADGLNRTIDQLGEELFSDEIISQALRITIFEKMQGSGDLSKNDEHRGYQEFLSEIERFTGGGGRLLQEISQLYKLGELKQRLLEAITSTEQLSSIVHNGKKKTKMTNTVKGALKETNLAKGTLAEIFGQYGLEAVTSLMAEQIPNLRGAKVARTGSSGNKPDITAVFGLDFEEILPIVDRWYENRAKAVEAQKQLNTYLSKAKNGFVVYTNVKDWTLGKRFGGFSSGSDLALSSFEGVISNTPGGSQVLIGQIMSTMDGAILSDKKEEIEDEVCEKMAYFLFDDVLTIGKETAASGHAIHLLLLDGVYIPLSYLFFLMARAIEEAERDIHDVFEVTITPGKITFESPWEPGMWSAQKQIAYSQIKIGARFLKGFAEMIREVKGA